MNRLKVIRKLAEHEITTMTHMDKLETIKSMQYEDWETDIGWALLPDKTKDILLNTDFSLQGIPDEFLNPAIIMEIQNHYRAVTSSYLEKVSIDIGIEIDVNIEEPYGFISCPCCGRKTLSERGAYEICVVCWWEDDGQDNKNASKVWGGPNEMHSLTQARANYIKFGISCPDRADLAKLKEPAEKYAAGRLFYFTDNETLIMENDTDWKVSTTQE